MKIAILGYGTVGKGVYDIVKNIEEPIGSKYYDSLDNYAIKNSHIEVKKILRRKGSKLELPCMTDDFNDIIKDDSIDTVVECLGGLEPAKTYILEAMKHGKNVVTSNKLVLANCYDEFINLAKEKKVYFLFEASVGGGIPFIENLSRLGYVDDVKGYKGIINATVNYILYKMTNESAEFDDVLNEAKAKGYAEQDPSSDIDGDDVLYKSIIAANVASRKSFNIDSVLKFGIRYITKSDIDFFKENNLVCKLISEYDGVNKTIMVIPELFDKFTAIANVPLNNNYIEIYTKTEGKLAFEGQGAGRYPTAHSVVQDLVRICQNSVSPVYTTDKVNVLYENFENSFYIRRKDEKGKIVKNVNEKDLRDKDILFVAKINK